MQSDEGLNAYGAVTWGQFFIYQGFHARLGWMHTTSSVDAVDEYAKAIVSDGGALRYRYATGGRPVRTEPIRIAFRSPTGSIAWRVFTAYHTHHGPVVRAADDKWIAVRLMNKPVEALTQSRHDWRHRFVC